MFLRSRTLFSFAPCSLERSLRRGFLSILPTCAGLLLLAAHVALASGPHWVAGVNTFNPSAKGEPVVWAGGQVSYYLDQGNLSSMVSQYQAGLMLNEAELVWNNVPTAAVHIALAGVLAEDVNGSNVTANVPAGTGAQLPADVQPSATSKPLGIIMDEDGSVINAIYGPDASDPANCTQNGVFTQVDNMAAAGTIVHSLMILNGRCATTSAQVTLMQYQMVRAFGRILGLDWSQANDAMFVKEAITSNGLAGWPLMHAYERLCTRENYNCMPNPLTLRLDDVAGVNRLYPVTAANLASFPGKQITAQATISVQGTIHFKRGQGMQGVNVLLTPLTGGVPDARYPVSAVSGVSFHANAGNPVEGEIDAEGNPLNRFGTDDQTKEGFFDLSGVPLPAGTTVSDYQLSFEAVDALYINGYSVGPYATGQVTPSGTLPVITLSQLSAGSVVTENLTISNSADASATDDGTEAAPNNLPANGEWLSRLTGYGHVGWFLFPARANRVFTVESVALGENGLPTIGKAGVMLGFWNGSDPLGSLPAVGVTQPFNGATLGLTTLNAQSGGGGQVRIAFADMRGDGRPDYMYRGRVLYADTVFPPRLTTAGGPIVIHGTGFRANSQVLVNGIAAAVTSVRPTQITAVAAAANGTTGVVAVTVNDPSTLGTTSILDGLSYDAYGTDQIGVVAAPSGTIAGGVPQPFTVRVLSANNVTPAANVVVSYTVIEGGAILGCGSATCAVMTNSAGMATLMLTPTSSHATQVQAALTSGASVIAEFAAGTAPAIAALTPVLYLASGGQATWQPVVLVLNNGSPVSGASVTWSPASAALTVQGGVSTTNQAGQAAASLTAGPLGAGSTATLNACETQARSVCALFTINGVSASLGTLQASSGVGQTLAASATAAPVILAVTDGSGHPLAGATVNFYEVLNAWQASCPVEGNCPAPETLARQVVTAQSDQNGMVTLTPLTGYGQPTTLLVNATTGAQSSLVFSINQHP